MNHLFQFVEPKNPEAEARHWEYEKFLGARSEIKKVRKILRSGDESKQNKNYHLTLTLNDETSIEPLTEVKAALFMTAKDSQKEPVQLFVESNASVLKDGLMAGKHLPAVSTEVHISQNTICSHKVLTLDFVEYGTKLECFSPKTISGRDSVCLIQRDRSYETATQAYNRLGISICDTFITFRNGEKDYPRYESFEKEMGSVLSVTQGILALWNAQAS